MKYLEHFLQEKNLEGAERHRQNRQNLLPASISMVSEPLHNIRICYLIIVPAGLVFLQSKQMSTDLVGQPTSKQNSHSDCARFPFQVDCRFRYLTLGKLISDGSSSVERNQTVGILQRWFRERAEYDLDDFSHLIDDIDSNHLPPAQLWVGSEYLGELGSCVLIMGMELRAIVKGHDDLEEANMERRYYELVRILHSIEQWRLGNLNR